MNFTTINPATGKPIQTYHEMPADAAMHIIAKTHQVYLNWRATSFAERTEKMLKVAELLEKNKNEHAKIISTEMGKPIKAARGEIDKCIWVCQHYAKHAEEYLKPRMIQTDMAKSFVSYQPRGIVFAIMPWNFPFWQVFRFAVPTLMASNAGLLKHAPNSTGAGLAIEKIFRDAGFPEDLFRTLILSNVTAAKVVADPRVTAVTLTGSTRAGISVGIEAAKSLKKMVLELGGCDPYIILEDADLDNAAAMCFRSRMQNSGQSCIAAKRFIVAAPVYDKFKQLIQDKLNDIVIGDPLDEKTNFGPIAREDLRAGIHQQVQASIAAGATLVTGGKIPTQDGYFYPPTILENVVKGNPAYDEEIFGPVMTFIKAKDEADAIHIANDTPYGLGSAVFTQDIARGEKIATEQIQAGACGVNTFIASDPRLPFGGIKASGHGRELAAEGIREFVNTKTILVK